MSRGKFRVQRPVVPELDISRPFAPDPVVAEWIQSVFISEDGQLHNEEHRHLAQAVIGVVWTNIPHSRQMHRVAAMAEQPVFQASGWKRYRQEQQMVEWFGQLPDFVITIDAGIAAQMDDAHWCALLEHELYHCAQALSPFGAPKFTKEGKPKFAIRGHDVEEFVGIVRRYGAGNAAGATSELVKAASKAPEVAKINIARACGTCHLAVA
jgi:hypothetical protein